MINVTMYENDIEEDELIECLDEIKDLPDNENTINVLGHLIVKLCYAPISSYISELQWSISGVIFFIADLAEVDDGLYINEKFGILSRYIEPFNALAKFYDDYVAKKPVWQSIKYLTGKSIDDFWNEAWREKSKKELSIHDVFAPANRDYYYKEFEKTAKWIKMPED